MTSLVSKCLKNNTNVKANNQTKLFSENKDGTLPNLCYEASVRFDNKI